MTIIRNLLRGLCALALIASSFAANAYIVPTKGVTYFRATVSYQGVNRSTLYFKPTATSSTKAPMLVMLHYSGGTGEAMAFLTEVQELVRDYGIWVALPDAIDGSWHDDPSDTSTIDDVGFINSVIDSAVKAYPIDAKRVTMAGFSDGAMMSLRYACAQPAKIAAAAAVSGVMLKSLVPLCTSPALATPMLMINGDADTIVKYSPSKYAIALSAPDSAKHWAKINGCPAAAKTSLLPDLSTSDGTRVQLDAYLGCATGNSVEFYTVKNGGHTWPGSPYNLSYQGKTSQDIDGTRTVWEFVKRFTR